MKKEKYLQIFNYLLEFSKIRSKPVRDIEVQESQYPEKLWLVDIPANPLFENIVNPDFDLSKDYWIKVTKPIEPTKPQFPAVPEILTEWIVVETLTDEENGPSLKDSIKVDDKEFLLEDNPEISKEFEEYINKKWLDDLIPFKEEYELYKQQIEVYEELAKTYKQLFSIYNKAEQFGEEYELIIGVGLLNFKEDDSSPKIFRHFFTQKVDINFEFAKNSSKISIIPNIESTPQIETDSIIDLFEQFDSQNIIEAEKSVKEYFTQKEITSIFDYIEDAIQMFAERISPDGLFDSTIDKPKTNPKKPTFSFSPCLILRKRNTRSYTALFEKIIENLDNEKDELTIPTLDDLIGIIPDTPPVSNKEQSDENNNYQPQPIFFPKEYNDEQIEIVEKIRHNNKVLVQGPPGTGKSHTIANLICHLLADGKKVLVTAYTQRALEVLREKLPEEFRNLAVNYLSGDGTSIQELQSSVNAINDELSSADLETYQAQIEKGNEDLKRIKRERAELTNRLVSIQERATRKQEINPYYKGTLLEIAESLEKESKNFEWYTDDYSDYDDTLLISGVSDFFKKNQFYKNVNLNEFTFEIPSLDNLPSLNELEEYKGLLSSMNQYSDQESLIIDCSNFRNLKEILNQIDKLYTKVDKVDLDSKALLITSLKRGKINHWISLLNKSERVLEKLNKIDLSEIDRNIEISYPQDKSVLQLKNDAQILLGYLKEGNSLSGFTFSIKKPFLPREIKERLYFIDGIRINGSPCDTEEEFEIVLTDISINQDFEELNEIWNLDSLPNMKLSAKFHHLKKIHDKTLSITDDFKKLSHLKSEVESISSVKIDLFDKESLKIILDKVNFNLIKNSFLLKKEPVKKTLFYLANDELHPIKEKTKSSINKLDLYAYEECLKEINILNERKSEFQNFESLKQELNNKIPDTVNKIENEEISEDDLHNLKNALIYKDCYWQLNKLMSEDYENQLIQELRFLEKEEKKITSVLASKMAWYAILNKLQGDHSLRQHLDAWVMAVKKIGKTGRGKRAMKFRKVAQREMEYCKDSVPCWIMPLYKVAETIQPEQGMYDYAIIDEASQIGPDAIFLLYIAKKIIIVGDDKQTSPEYVGVDANIMNPYIKQHLNSIPFADYYGTEFSFFDHAKLFCNGMTVLREHFRCMPEIIEFSNRHFYAPDGKPLYPLKQYSENRLEPLKTVFCPDGYIEGRGSRIINEPEAKKIADTIKEIVFDNKYEGKTIGVITLQGNQQARLIEDKLINIIGEKEFHSRKIICGNSAYFQGDERDIIILSLVTAHNHNRSSLTRPEDERRFNVAVSRAKEQVWLFHSVQLEDLSNTNDLRYKVLDHFKNYDSYQPIYNEPIERKLGNQPAPFDSWFEVDVYNDIVNKGLSVIPQYQIAKGRYRIDLVALLQDGTKLAIECDGDKWHGPEQYLNDIMRQKVLERSGWQFFRVRGYEYYSNREKALKPFWETVENQASSRQSERENLQNLSNSEKIIKETETDITKEINISSIDNDSFDKVDDLETESPHLENKGIDSTIIRYLNLYKNGTYILSEKQVEKADYILPIRDSDTMGFLLQCYASGHINKVNISSLLSKRIDREYMNGLNTENELSLLTVIPTEKILGIYFRENGTKKFKAHLTENISARDQLHLKGMKVMYNNFDSIQFKILPLSLKENLGTLLRSSFTANGAAVNNDYYSEVWKVLKSFNFINIKKLEKPTPLPPTDEMIGTLFEKRVSLNKVIHLQFSNNPNIIKVRLVEFETNSNEIEDGVQLVNYKKPLGHSIFDRAIGESVKVGNTDNKVKIIDIE